MYWCYIPPLAVGTPVTGQARDVWVCHFPGCFGRKNIFLPIEVYVKGGRMQIRGGRFPTLRRRGAGVTGNGPTGCRLRCGWNVEPRFPRPVRQTHRTAWAASDVVKCWPGADGLRRAPQNRRSPVPRPGGGGDPPPLVQQGHAAGKPTHRMRPVKDAGRIAGGRSHKSLRDNGLRKRATSPVSAIFAERRTERVEKCV
jgi:hypothetical protein